MGSKADSGSSRSKTEGFTARARARHPLFFPAAKILDGAVSKGLEPQPLHEPGHPLFGALWVCFVVAQSVGGCPRIAFLEIRPQDIVFEERFRHSMW